MYLVYAVSDPVKQYLRRMKKKQIPYLLGGIPNGVFLKDTEMSLGLMLGMKLRYRDGVEVMRVEPMDVRTLLARLREVGDFKVPEYPTVEPKKDP